jgi:hypothetical protein
MTTALMTTAVAVAIATTASMTAAMTTALTTTAVAVAIATTGPMTGAVMTVTDRRGSDSRNVGFTVAAAACALFCVVLIFLALQMRAGEDPAIGAGPEAESPQARQVIVRRAVEGRPRASAPAPVATRAP